MSTALSMCLCLWLWVTQAGSVFTSASATALFLAAAVNLNTESPWVSFAFAEWIISAANGAVNKWRLSATPTIWIWIWIAGEQEKANADRQQAPSHSRRHFRPVEGGARTRHKTDLLGHCWRGGRVSRIDSVYLHSTSAYLACCCVSTW